MSNSQDKLTKEIDDILNSFQKAEEQSVSFASIINQLLDICINNWHNMSEEDREKVIDLLANTKSIMEK